MCFAVHLSRLRCARGNAQRKPNQLAILWCTILPVHFCRTSAPSVYRGGPGGLALSTAHPFEDKPLAPLTQVRQLGGLGGLLADYFRAQTTTERSYCSFEPVFRWHGICN